MIERYLLWIDDDQELLDHAVSRLRENGILVRVEPNVDRAVELLESEREKMLGVLVDLMMDPGTMIDSEAAQQGYETGFRLLDYMQSKSISLEKVLIFTNSQVESKSYRPRGCKTNVKIQRKSRYKGIKFLEFVKKEFVVGSEG